MLNKNPSCMSRFVDHATFALDAWYEGRYGEERKSNAKLSTEIIDKFVRDLGGWIYMFHSIEDWDAMNKRDMGMMNDITKLDEETTFKMTKDGIAQINKEKDYDA